MMNSKPNKITFSVIMPTLNSEKTIKDSLEAIRKQKFDQAKVEIIIADGGSADRTREIAASFGAVVVNNPKVTPENGIQVGMLKATGDYWCIIGSDEIWLDKLALQKRLNLFRSDPNVKNIVTAGLLTPDNYPRVSRYINSFGDPFSFFIYRLDGEEYYKSLKSRYNHRENKDGLVLEFKKEDVLPIVDGAQTIDSQFFRSIFPKISPEIIPLVFFNMANQTHKLGVIKGDYTLHYSASKIITVYKKARWRVENNVFKPTSTNSGFSNRAARNKKISLKKLLFLPYAATLVFPLVDALYLCLKKKDFIFIHHFLLSEYVAFLIVYYYTLKVFGLNVESEAYGK